MVQPLPQEPEKTDGAQSLVSVVDAGIQNLFKHLNAAGNQEGIQILITAQIDFYSNRLDSAIYRVRLLESMVPLSDAANRVQYLDLIWNMTLYRAKFELAIHEQQTN